METVHKAPYSNGSHFDDDDVIQLRKELSTLMPELGIDVVLQGHDHVYLRTGVMNNNEVVQTKTKTVTYGGRNYTAKLDPTGSIYVISGLVLQFFVELPDEFIGVGLRYTQLVRNFFRPDESVLHMDSSFLLI